MNLRHYLLPLWIFLGLILSYVDAVKVSFFGASHINMPLQEAKLSTNVRLKFRSRQSNALIFLTSGRTDHCLLTLNEGRIKFQLKVNEYETELWSPKQFTFNDLMWHEVVILRYETNLTLQIDEHFVRRTLPVDVRELNVHFGVFLGGMIGYTSPYLQGVDNFRGCISDVFYNNINILKRAREKSNHVETERITWNCAPEFDAENHETISFVDDLEGFMVYRKAFEERRMRNGDAWSFDFKTIEEYGALLYNLEQSNRFDYLALEIIDSRLRLLVGKGSNAVELIPDKNVSDGQWHSVIIDYNPSEVKISVDDILNTASFANGSSNYLELGQEFHIGGLDSDAQRKRATNKGFHAKDASFKGCMKNIYINSELIGFPKMKITHGTAIGCVWKYPCIDTSPCVLSATCHQQGIDDFICSCDQNFCIRNDYQQPYKLFTTFAPPEHIPLLEINPMTVLEGGYMFLSPEFVRVVFEFSRLKLHESNILFNITQQPKYGKLSILGNGEHYNETHSRIFSLIDLQTDKVKYTHDGSEHFSDHMGLEMQFGMKDNIGIILEKRKFMLHVNVTPVNDPPVLKLPSNKILRLIQGIPKVLGSDLLTAYDPDSSNSSLIFTILMKPSSEGENGILEVNGKQAESFSQEDVNNKLVTYLVNSQHTKDTFFDISLQVSDGIETSSSETLQVSVQPLQLRMMNNTGLVMIHKSPSLITPSNLSFTTNSDDDNLDVKFDISRQPHHGVIQKLRSVDSSWISVETFTSNQLQLGQIRYHHTSQEFPHFDEFKFTATLGPVKSSVYDFRITFTKLRIGIQKHQNKVINGTKDTVIDNECLYHQTTPIPTFSRTIIYTLLAVPRFGFLYVAGYDGSAKAGDSFTQHDIDERRIRYKTFRTSYSSFVDDIEFIVTVPECEDIIGSIKIIYNPDESLAKTLTYQRKDKLYVNEGERTAISRIHFDVLLNKFNSLSFNLTHSPNHGDLCLINNEYKERIETFQLENLYLGDVFYCHDDSESNEDSMKILITSDSQTDFQYVSEIAIDIYLQNDNPPVRQIDKKFPIVRGDSKIITSAELKYSDPDIDSRTADIIYRNIQSTNGEVMIGGITALTFNQDDVDNMRVYFNHSGDDYGRVNFIVTDGTFDVPGILEIEASDPFLKIREVNASIVREGNHVPITLEDLSIETNLNVKPDQIEYKIIEDPSHGVLKYYRKKYNLTYTGRHNNTTSIKNFTQAEVEKERIAYLNTEVASMDRFKYRVTAKSVWTEGELLIRIYPTAYWEPLQIKRNQTLYVEESTSVTISRDILEIGHSSISPGDITYLVTTSPQHGYLEIQSITSDDEYNSKVFDQSTINSEKMFYIQAGVNQSSDYFMFDVTNGIYWLRDLILKIVIIPENLYVKTAKLYVEEGKSVKLTPEHMTPYSEYYIGKIIEYKILELPRFGSIKSGKSSKINRFTQKQLEANVVQYIHSGSEDHFDSMRLIAYAKNKESLPFELFIEIQPVNDEVPVMVTNTGLQMWIGGKSVLKNTDLMVQDYDTPPDNLTYHIQHLSGGYLSYKNFFNRKIHNFTQEDINRELIYFINDYNTQSGQMGQVVFYVTDGIHNTSEQILYVTSNPVVLEVDKNEFLHVFPLTRKQILPDQLFYKCSDVDREIKYQITVIPQIGKIIREDTSLGITNEVQEFTQDDIENGRIFYEHTSPMVELRTNDSFFFDVKALFAPSLIDQAFNIEISVSSGGLLKFLPNIRIVVDEGDLAPIHLDLSRVLEYLETRVAIQSPELYVETYQPSHGYIKTMDSRKDINRFSLIDFNSNKVYYQHDHSDTVEDKISMAVYLLVGNIFLCNITIPVTVNPLNDQPFYLITTSPRISVIEGENKTITNADLLTEDADTSPDGIIYEIISNPMHGMLQKISDEGYVQNIISYGNQFTQADINDRRIIYTHSGSRPESTTFTFKVSDGEFKPAYETFAIKILPIQIFPSFLAKPLTVQQGSNIGNLTVDHVSIETNVQKSRLIYNITKLPIGGILNNNNKQIFRFNQRQLEDGIIQYVQNDMTRSNDSFQVNAYIPDSSSSLLVDILIVVEPFIQIVPITVTPSNKVRLMSTFVPDNPTQLKLNRYNPKIVISRKPQFGKLRKIRRSTGDVENVNDKDVTSFTFKEMKSGIIYYVARKFPPGFNGINDTFEYILTTKTAQPAQGIVNVEIQSPNRIGEDYVPEIPAPDLAFIPFDIMCLLAILFGIILFLILIILIIKCRPSKKAKKDPAKDNPPHLPRPPDFITMNNTRSMYTPSDNESLPITQSSTPLPVLSNVPHCKVIPIGQLDIQDSDPEDMIDMREDAREQMLRGYGYSEGPESWTSSLGDMGTIPEVSYSSIAQPQHIPPKINPLLRRNQYWV